MLIISFKATFLKQMNKLERLMGSGAFFHEGRSCYQLLFINIVTANGMKPYEVTINKSKADTIIIGD